MRSVPTTSADLTDPGFLADPYPVLAALRAQGPVLQHEPTGRWLVLDHAGVGRTQGAAVITPGRAAEAMRWGACAGPTRSRGPR